MFAMQVPILCSQIQPNAIYASKMLFVKGVTYSMFLKDFIELVKNQQTFTNVFSNHLV